MTNEELRAENILLKQQLEELTSLTSNSEPDWKSLVGKYNEEANDLIKTAIMKNQISYSRKHNLNPEAGTEWTNVDEILYEANKFVVANETHVHAVYEARERKRNGQLGLPPTLAELVSMIRDEPSQTNLDANSPTHTQAEIKAKTLTK
jgi:hypothetical protein